MATTANRLREYETLYALNAEISDDQVEQINLRIKGVVQREGGKVIRLTHWGRRKTAYEVRKHGKHSRANYVHLLYLGGPQLVHEVERNLRMLDEVLKFQSGRLADDVDPASRAEEPDVRLESPDEREAREMRPEGEESSEEDMGEEPAEGQA